MKEKFNSDYFKTIDTRCRYWLLTKPSQTAIKKKLAADEYSYVEGVIRRIAGKSNVILWEPLSISNKILFKEKLISDENFISLIRNEGIVRITPDTLALDYIKIYTSKKIERDYFSQNNYFELEIPVLIENRGGIAIYSACKDLEFYTKMEDYN